MEQVENCYNSFMEQEHKRKTSFQPFMRLSGAFCLLAMAVLLGSCSSEPSDRRARADLQKWFENRWSRTVVIMEHEVINKASSNGNYLVEYRAKARFIRDASGCVLTCCGEVCFDKLVDGFKWIEKTSGDPRVIRKGDTFETRGKRTYTKTGGGWQCEEM